MTGSTIDLPACDDGECSVFDSLRLDKANFNYHLEKRSCVCNLLTHIIPRQFCAVGIRRPR